MEQKPLLAGALVLSTTLPIACQNKAEVAPRLRAYRITPTQLRDFDDIATDLLIDSVYPEVTIRKNCNTYSSTCENRKDIVSIIKNVAIKQRDPARAVSQLFQVPDLKRFLDNLASADEKEDLQKHMRKYVNLYLPDCPFEVSRTTRYSPLPEAALKARRDIEKGEITYLCGAQACFTGGEIPDQDDLSVTQSSRHKLLFRMAGPTRFANHECDPNACLKSTEPYDEVKIIALRKIWAGEEITVSYENNAFGRDNCHCLCETSKPRMAKHASRYLRSVREEIPISKAILALMERRHKELYGWEWPRTR